jgi:hypothetical protein
MRELWGHLNEVISKSKKAFWELANKTMGQNGFEGFVRGKWANLVVESLENGSTKSGGFEENLQEGINGSGRTLH